MDILGSARRRLFTIEGDHRLMRPHPQDDLKCPRCDSVNTKFCYYNNYNLSQPRHFCRSCRRYWTKGGVLRNVPVGGGIRKPKRSGKHNSKTSFHSSDAVVTEHNENSSSNSSSVTANTTSVNITATTKGMTTTDVSRSSSSTNSTPAMLLNFNEPSTQFSNFSHSLTQVTTIDPLIVNQASSARNTSTEQQNHLQWTETGPIHKIDYGVLESKRSNDGLAGNGDWQDSAYPGLFGQSYWSQNHINEDDRGSQFSYLS